MLTWLPYRQCLQVYAHMYAFPFIALLLSCLPCMKMHGTPMETNNFKKVKNNQMN